MDIAKLHNLAISDTGFIFDPVSGNCFTTNETGLFIIKNLKEGRAVEQIVTEMAAQFEVDQEVGEQDILQLIEDLRANYLI